MSYRGRSTFFVIINRFVDSLRPKNLRSNVKHMGSDYLGNNYFENHSKQLFDAKSQPKRWFKPPHEDLWDRELPPEWNSWLRQTRTDPPTTEEIEYNLSVERKKKELDAKSKPVEREERDRKTHGFSNFPTYEEYDDFSGTKTSKTSKRNKDNT
ncbi:unnamed protein product [Oppiella nova]|uniref:NADH dehydrogenase [ubiquinone] 1 alpha subcomplex subunit 12 n=1 Tax=Oppiella nova TaxID=334625 RepID=A0A7R9QXR4_9ACAR|nr:unnamed protein product [Oppiella nova]CAG2179485.1 unnamed protein product [Oppiella nova]